MSRLQILWNYVHEQEQKLRISMAELYSTTRFFFKRMMRSLFFVFTIAILYAAPSHAVLQSLDERMITDSEDPYHRRIYTYDMGIDSKGDVHIVYLQPIPENGSVGYLQAEPGRVNVGATIYVRRKSGVWQQPVILTRNGLSPTASTRLVVGDDDSVHVCYVENQEDGDGGDFDPSHDLYLAYQKIIDGVPGPRQVVSPGAWHSAIQLDDQGRAMFLREDADWRQGDAPKFALFTTEDGQEWSRNLLDIPVNLRRLKSFQYSEGKYHILYCDNAITRNVIDGFWSTNTKPGLFYDLHYASSVGGESWQTSIVDDSFTLYKDEFWTSMVVDGTTATVAMHVYAEYGNEYNTGTSALFAKWTGSGWRYANITPANYAATREGMGVGLVPTGNGGYYGGWDFSPTNTYDENFQGANGNIALAEIAPDGNITGKWQVAEFSAEGEVQLKINNGRLGILALGDYRDARLHYWEYDVGTPFRSSVGPSGASPTPPAGNSRAVSIAVKYLLLAK